MLGIDTHKAELEHSTHNVVQSYRDPRGPVSLSQASPISRGFRKGACEPVPTIRGQSSLRTKDYVVLEVASRVQYRRATVVSPLMRGLRVPGLKMERIYSNQYLI